MWIPEWWTNSYNIICTLHVRAAWCSHVATCSACTIPTLPTTGSARCRMASAVFFSSILSRTAITLLQRIFLHPVLYDLFSSLRVTQKLTTNFLYFWQRYTQVDPQAISVLHLLYCSQDVHCGEGHIYSEQHTQHTTQHMHNTSLVS